jgi:hypothetical protein
MSFSEVFAPKRTDYVVYFIKKYLFCILCNSKPFEDAITEFNTNPHITHLAVVISN